MRKHRKIAGATWWGSIPGLSGLPVLGRPGSAGTAASRAQPSLASAALRPHTPCTPPPGAAPALPRYSCSMGVSARPNPGAGRKINCW